MSEDFVDFVAFVVLFLAVLLVFSCGYSLGEKDSKQAINDLCNKYQYDFCVLSERTYELKRD